MKSTLPLLLFFIFISTVTSKAQNQYQAAAEAEQDPLPAKVSRYMGSVEMGFLYGKIENPWGNPPSYLTSPSILIFNGYRSHRLFTIGIATGFDFYENILITPIGLGIRGELLNNRISPFYSVDAGYGSGFLSGKGNGERPEGGGFINPAVGLRVKMDNHTAFLFGIGYKEQTVDREFPERWGPIVNQRITYKRLSLRMGFMF